MFVKRIFHKFVARHQFRVKCVQAFSHLTDAVADI